MHEKTIMKIGAIITNESGQILAVHKRGKPEHQLIVPGGKQEPGETDACTLKRELLEELNIEVRNYHFFGEFKDRAIYEHAWLIMRVYQVSISGTPQPSNEIDDIVWVGSNYQTTHYQFASILGMQLLPKIFSNEESRHA